MKKTVTFLLTLFVTMLGFAVQAQAPQTGVYRIQNVGKPSYVKVTGKYDAQLVTSQSDASFITVGIEKKLSDGTYKVNSLASTYGSENTPVEVYDYIPKALTLAEVELRKVLSSSSESNIQLAISRMHDLARDYGFMRMMPVDGQADTYHAVAVLPYIPNDIVEAWEAKVDYEGTMWEWCKELVINYLNTHGTDSGLAARIRNNLANIKEGHTYMLTADTDGSFGYIETGANIKNEETGETTVNTSTLTSDNNRSWWKLTPKVNNENVKDGTYKIRNIGKGKYVRIRGRYYATPDAEEGAASDIRITFNGKNDNGDQKIVNLGGTYEGADIDIYNYIEKAIMIGKMAIRDVLTDGTQADPANGENIAYAQQVMEEFVKDNAFMSIKPVEGKDDAVYAYAYIPHIPEAVVTAMANHHAIADDDESLAWAFGVQKVKDYLEDHSGAGGTDNTLRSYILANIDNIKPGVTYYLSAHPSDGTFDYYPKGAGAGADADFAVIKDDLYYQWGSDVVDVEEDNLTSGTYKIRNVEYKNYVHVISKYYAKPDADDVEVPATEIHITYNGKLDDGSYKVTNMTAVAEDGSMCDIQSYVDKAIMLGRVAIADVLSGETTIDGQTVHVASPENIKKAQDYMEQFVRASAFMRVKPVVGTNYVYAIATIPEIPAAVVEEMVAHIEGVNNAQDCWNYGKQYVLNYLEGHPNSTLVALITNNLNNLTPGHTYYLSEDADGTFGYKDYDEGEVSLDDTTLQWGIDLEEEDQPVESDFYKIHNVGQDKYVKVYPPYYAKPDQDDENEATPIAVTIGEQMPDGGYKVTNLVGDGCDVQQYVQHAIDLGEGVIDQVLNGVSTPEHIAQAKQTMREFIEANAYMQIRQVPGEENAYYAYATAPVIPEEITSEWRKKYPTSVWPGDMWSWCVAKVKEYLAGHSGQGGTNSTLVSLIMNNIDEIEEGHTYYLSAESNGTFGYKDANEMNFTDRNFWWGFAEAVKAEPFSGYYRIKGADGKYVNVTGQFASAPNLGADNVKTAAGSVIYVGTGETKNAKTLPVEILRSQGVDVGSTAGYMFMINDVLKVVANKVAEIAADKIEDTNYSQYAGLIEPAVQTLLESVDLNLYVEPTITSDSKDAYMLEVSTPDLAEYVDLAQTALSLMGKNGTALANKIREMKTGENGIMDKLLEAAAQCAELLDGQSSTEAADDIWALLKQKGKTFLSSYSQQLSAVLPQQAINFISNALNNPDFNYGTTYCLRQDADGTFGYASRESMVDKDEAKWILEPFDEQDPNYDADTYKPFVVNAPFPQTTYTQGKPTGTYNYTTTYLDFDAKIETSNVTVYTVADTEKLSVTKDGVTKVYYLATLTPVESNTIPAATPAVLRASETDTQIELRPVNKPEHPAVESDELGSLKEAFLYLLFDKLDDITGAPRLQSISPKAISQPASDNLLVGSFFDASVESGLENSYLELGQKEALNGGLDMNGLGFWKNEVSTLKGNNAYLLGCDPEDVSNSFVEDFYFDTAFEEGEDGIAPGYIFQYKDDTFTRIEDVNNGKEVKSIRYYNTLGIESATPFEGVNIIVTTFTDGTKAVVKAIK